MISFNIESVINAERSKKHIMSASETGVSQCIVKDIWSWLHNDVPTNYVLCFNNRWDQDSSCDEICSYFCKPYTGTIYFNNTHVFYSYILSFHLIDSELKAILFFPTTTAHCYIKITINENDITFTCGIVGVPKKCHFANVDELYKHFEEIVNERISTDSKWTLDNYFDKIPKLALLQCALDKCNFDITNKEIIIEI